MTMYATLQMDREIDPNIHYISIGGFELRFSNGVAIAFDFNSSVANIRKDPSYIRFECDEPDFDSFPEAELLEWLLLHSEVEKSWSSMSIQAKNTKPSSIQSELTQ